MRAKPAVPSRTSGNGDFYAAFALDVGYYLTQDPRQLPSRYLYDELGSSLFDAICRLPWYSITRAEMRLLAARAREIFELADPVARIVELGGGNGGKLVTLIRERPSRARCLETHLIDVSSTALADSIGALEHLPAVQAVAHEASYETGLLETRDLPPPGGRTLTLFLGSNIGNFDPPGAQEFLREIRASCRAGDFFLLGADLVKTQPLLELAYDDPLGVTAAFNRNILVRINRELGGNFDLAAFAHRACWNAEASRVEMHLVARERQDVHVEASNLDITIGAGESIWTESSYKYEPEALVSLATSAGFTRAEQWVDAEDRFALTLFEAS
jgi:dimethylhistidine N-methyltransferase